MNIPLSAPPPEGGGSGRVLINSYIANGSTSTTGSVSIDSGYTMLEIIARLRTEEADNASGVLVDINGDTTQANYDGGYYN